MKRPAYQHYVGDWHGDMELQGCSLAARGLWIEMLGLMHMGTPYGHLTVKGKDMAQKDTLIGYLAGWTGIAREDVSNALSELEGAEVFSYTSDGIAYSRRMVRDEEIRQARANGGVKSQEHPNVPRKKDVVLGNPLRTTTKDTLSVEDEVEDESKSVAVVSKKYAPPKDSDIRLALIARRHPALSHLKDHEIPHPIVTAIMKAVDDECQNTGIDESAALELIDAGTARHIGQAIACKKQDFIKSAEKFWTPYHEYRTDFRYGQREQLSSEQRKKSATRTSLTAALEEAGFDSSVVGPDSAGRTRGNPVEGNVPLLADGASRISGKVD